MAGSLGARVCSGPTSRCAGRRLRVSTFSMDPSFSTRHSHTRATTITTRQSDAESALFFNLLIRRFLLDYIKQVPNVTWFFSDPKDKSTDAWEPDRGPASQQSSGEGARLNRQPRHFLHIGHIISSLTPSVKLTLLFVWSVCTDYRSAEYTRRTCPRHHLGFRSSHSTASDLSAEHSFIISLGQNLVALFRGRVS